MTLHGILDFQYGDDGDVILSRMLAEGADPDERRGAFAEAPLHVATRRRRCGAIQILLDHGASIDARTVGGKTAYAHAARRGFGDVVNILSGYGADESLTAADRFAVAVLNRRLDEAGTLLAVQPTLARTGNPEEDRLLADAAGRRDAGAVSFLLTVGADLTATGLDSGTPLHQAAWFGQPENVRLLVNAGAPLEVFDSTHRSSPLGWAVHGSRCSGGAAERQDEYVEIVELLLQAGAAVRYPDGLGADTFSARLAADASPRVRELLGPS